LQELKKHDFLLSVATNAPTLFAKTMLSHLNVADMFEVIIGADKVKASKPDPEMLRYILNFYNFDASSDKAWMIGDNSKDIQSAKNAKINAIFAAWGFSAHGEHNILIKNPKEVLDIVL